MALRPLTKARLLKHDFRVHGLGPTKTYKMGLSWRSARSPAIKTVTGTGAIQRGFVQLKGAWFLLQGPGSHCGPIDSPYSPSVPLTGALFNCLLVGQSLGLNCIGLRGAFKNIPPGTKPIHAGKHSWRINFYPNTCGACIHTCEYRKII